MEIITNEKIIKELQIALSYYIKGLTISQLNNDWTSPIQRIMENALLTYTVIDIRKGNFLELINVLDKESKIRLIFSNSNCKYASAIKKVEIYIPYIKRTNNSYQLTGNVKVKIKINN